MFLLVTHLLLLTVLTSVWTRPSSAAPVIKVLCIFLQSGSKASTRSQGKNLIHKTMCLVWELRLVKIHTCIHYYPDSPTCVCVQSSPDESVRNGYWTVRWLSVGSGTVQSAQRVSMCVCLYWRQEISSWWVSKLASNLAWVTMTYFNAESQLHTILWISDCFTAAVCTDGTLHKYGFTTEGNTSRESYDMFLNIGDDQMWQYLFYHFCLFVFNILCSIVVFASYVWFSKIK